MKKIIVSIIPNTQKDEIASFIRISHNKYRESAGIIDKDIHWVEELIEKAANQ